MQQQRREMPPQPQSYKHNNSHRSKGSPQTTEPNRMINMLFYKIRTARLLYKRSCSKHEQQTTINSYEKLFQLRAINKSKNQYGANSLFSKDLTPIHSISISQPGRHTGAYTNTLGVSGKRSSYIPLTTV